MKDNLKEKYLEQEEQSLTSFLMFHREEIQEEKERRLKRLFMVGALYGAGFVLIATYNWRISLGLILVVLAREIHDFNR